MHAIRARGLRAAVILLLMLPVLAAAAAAGESGAISGRVVDPEGAAVPGATVRLHNDVTGYSAVAVTGAGGGFTFVNLPLNPYVVSVSLEGFSPASEVVEVRTSLPKVVTLKLELPGFAESVTVSGSGSPVQLETGSSTSHVDIDRSFIVRAPAAVASRAMEQIVTSTPGFAKDENGRFHFQGAHSQGEYVIDGQTISDQTGAAFSNSIDPGIARSMEIIYGNVPAEFGEKMGAVVNLTTRSGLRSGPWRGSVTVGAARFSTREAAADAGWGTDRLGLFASVDASRSARFLDPLNFAGLHDDGSTARGFLRLDWAASSSSSLRLTALAGRTDRDVPNTFTQQAAGQDQRVHTRDANANAGWQRLLSDTAVLDVLVFGRTSSYELVPSPGDTPLSAASKRSLDNVGVAPSLTWAAGAHEVKIGGTFKRIPIDERFSFGITDPAFNDPADPAYNPNLEPYDLTRGGSPFLFSARRTGTYWALYAQDTVRAGNLTVSAGLRFDHNDLPLSEHQLEPRVGAAYLIESTRTVLRVSYNRVFYTPELENLLFSSSRQAALLAPPAIRAARALGGGELPVLSERQDAYTLGVQQAIGSRLRLDADLWERRATFPGDQDQFLDTGIVFPLSFSHGRLHGWDLRLDLVAGGGWRGFLSAGHTRAVYAAPPSGGLFLDTEALEMLTGGPFLIDHDQDLSLQATVTRDLGATGFWLGANVRYDSGLVTDADPAELAGDPDNAFAIPFIRVHTGGWTNPNRVAPRTVWDLSLGYDPDPARPFGFQVDVLNLLDERGLYNVLSVFGGTHVIPPRTLAARVTWRL